MAVSTKHFAMPASAVQLDSQVFEMWARIGILYKDALDASAYDLIMSSTRIVQEHTLRAMLSASESCARALAQNAAKVQQQSFARLVTANQKAAEIVGQGWIDAMASSMSPAAR